MKQIIFSIIGTVAILIFIFFYSKNTELDKMTNQEIRDYFYKNKKDLDKIIDFCTNYPSLKRVDREEIKFYKKNVSKETKDIAHNIQTIIKSIKIDSIECSRLKEILNNNLLGVSFLLYSSGIGVSGEGQFLEYNTKQSRKYQKEHKPIDIPWQTEVPIEDGWVIVNTK